MSIRHLKGSITLIAVATILVRIVWPDLKIDSITLGLLVLGALPWLAPLIKSAELPGGWKIEFQEVQAAGNKVTGPLPEAPVTPSPPPGGATVSVPPGELRLEGLPPTILTGPPDPNLELVAVRIEIEKRLRVLGNRAGAMQIGPLKFLVASLVSSGVLTRDEAGGLLRLIDVGNQAAHGASVEPSVSTWVRTEFPAILATLDRRIAEQ